MLAKIFKKNNFIFLVCLGIFFLFSYITYKTPLSGDDWGFYLNSQMKNPVELAYSYYFSFSGRFFSEFWEHLGSGNKVLWNILNPSLFMLIVFILFKISRIKKIYVLGPLIIVGIILSVDDNLRMETYSWLTGEIYIIPLTMSLVHFYLVENYIRSGSSSKINWIICTFLSFYIGLTVENIAATVFIGNVLLLVYFFVNRKEISKLLLICTILSLFSFLIMRSSPGSEARLLRDHLEWSNLDLIGKFQNGYPYFIEFTFINYNYLILFLSGTILLSSFFGTKKISVIYRVFFAAIHLTAIFSVFSFVMRLPNNFLLDKYSIFSLVFWPAYSIVILVYLFFYFQNYNRYKVFFFFLLAGLSNLAMIFSPIFGSRSSIYTVFYMIVVVLMIFDTLELPKVFRLIVFGFLLIVIVDRVYEYYFKYNLVGKIYQERLEIIRYYQEHPEDEEVWIPRFPPYTIHGADIEPGDDYHFETFKEFYNLPQDSNNITFYFKDSYD